VWGRDAGDGALPVLDILLQNGAGIHACLPHRRRFRGSGFWTTVILIPMMLSPAVVGNFWAFLYQPQIGLFNYVVSFFTRHSPLVVRDDRLGQSSPPWAIVIVDTWMDALRDAHLSCRAALDPDYIYEAAEVDRASRWRQFWSITLPMALPFIMPRGAVSRHRELQDVRHGQSAHFGRTGVDDRGGLDHPQTRGVRKVADRLPSASAFAVVLFVTVFGLANIYASRHSTA